MFYRLLVLATCAFLAMGGCKSKGQEAVADGSPPPADSAAVQIPPPDEVETRVFRYQPAAKRVSKLTLSSLMGESFGWDVELSLVLRCTALRCDYEVRSANLQRLADANTEVAPSFVRRLAQAYQGMKGSITMKEGELIVARKAGIAQTAPDLSEVIRSLVIPVPIGPIGVGTRWQVTGQLDAMRGDATYVVESIDGSALTVVVQQTWKTKDSSRHEVSGSVSGKVRVEPGSFVATTEKLELYLDADPYVLLRVQ